MRHQLPGADPGFQVRGGQLLKFRSLVIYVISLLHIKYVICERSKQEKNTTFLCVLTHLIIFYIIKI